MNLFRLLIYMGNLLLRTIATGQCLSIKRSGGITPLFPDLSTRYKLSYVHASAPLPLVPLGLGSWLSPELMWVEGRRKIWLSVVRLAVLCELSSPGVMVVISKKEQPIFRLVSVSKACVTSHNVGLSYSIPRTHYNVVYLK
jgi:hypothetical protein